MKKKYILSGFESREMAQERNHEFAVSAGMVSPTLYMFPVHCLVKEQWGLEVSEQHLHLLNDEEKTSERLKEIPHRPFVNSNVPMVFRYLESKWVDEFIEDGSIRLSSFAKFHKHKDEQRGDPKEGRNVLIGSGGDHKTYSVVGHGHDAFVLSTSLMSDDRLMEDFEVDSYFVIERPHHFMDEVLKQIPEFTGVQFGPCLYLPNKTIQRSMSDFKIDDVKDEDDSSKFDMTKMFAANQKIGGAEVFFSKELKYANQHEYRMVWHSAMNPMPENIDLKVPDARKYCRKIN